MISSSTDGTIKIWKTDDNLDVIKNPNYNCISTIKDYEEKLTKKQKMDYPYWISSLSIKENEIIELYAGDTKGNIHIYEFYDKNSAKLSGYEYKFKQNGLLSRQDNTFNYNRTITLHSLSVIKAYPSVFDTLIYSIGFDSQLLGFNIKDNKSINVFFKHRNSKNQQFK